MSDWDAPDWFTWEEAGVWLRANFHYPLYASYLDKKAAAGELTGLAYPQRIIGIDGQPVPYRMYEKEYFIYYCTRSAYLLGVMCFSNFLNDYNNVFWDMYNYMVEEDPWTVDGQIVSAYVLDDLPNEKKYARDLVWCMYLHGLPDSWIDDDIIYYPYTDSGSWAWAAVSRGYLQVKWGEYGSPLMYFAGALGIFQNVRSYMMAHNYVWPFGIQEFNQINDFMVHNSLYWYNDLAGGGNWPELREEITNNQETESSLTTDLWLTLLDKALQR